jgi:hypothetical protein
MSLSVRKTIRRKLLWTGRDGRALHLPEAWRKCERSLVPVSRLHAWIAQNIYLRFKSVPFSKDNEMLLPEAGSCANCPKRTGFNIYFIPKFGKIRGS